MAEIEHPFSDLLRSPTVVVGDLDAGDVLLRRRGAPALRLSRADRDDRRADAYAVAGRTLRNIAIHAPGTVRAALLDEFAWTSYLPAPDQATFAEEFTRAVVAGAELDNFEGLGQLLAEWRRTAEIHADPALADRLRGAIEAGGDAVARPGG